MEPRESLSNNVLLSCGVLVLTAALVLSLTLAGAVLFVVLGG